MQVPFLRTERLTLLACDRATLAAVMRDEAIEGLERHPAWPSDDLRGAVPFMLARIAENPESAGWGPWLIVRDGIVIGDAGAHGPPDDAGVVEIGFSIVAPARGHGIATEAVAAILGWMREQPGFREAIARTHKDNAPAQGVLRRCGLRPAGEEQDHVLFTTA